MNIKQLLTVTALAAGAVSAQANVVTSVVGNTTTYTEDFNGGSSFNGGLAIPGADGYLSLSILGSTSSFAFTAASAVESLTVSFYYAARATAANWSLTGPVQSLGNTGSAGQVFLTNPGAGGSTYDALVSYTWNNLAAGNYALSFSSGTGLARSLKVDDVSIAVTNVAAVPEPETYAMMLAGLMLMGTIARRRNKKQG